MIERLRHALILKIKLYITRAFISNFSLDIRDTQHKIYQYVSVYNNSFLSKYVLLISSILHAISPFWCSFMIHIYIHNSNILFISLYGILFLNMLEKNLS